MHLTKMRIGGDIAPFTRAVSFNLDERVNLHRRAECVRETRRSVDAGGLLHRSGQSGQKADCAGLANSRIYRACFRTLVAIVDESVAEYASRLGMTNFLAASADWFWRQGKIRLCIRCIPLCVRISARFARVCLRYLRRCPYPVAMAIGP